MLDHQAWTEGVFLPDGTFVPLLKLAAAPFLQRWEAEVFALLKAEGEITEDGVAKMGSWQHSGFSVAQSVPVHNAVGADFPNRATWNYWSGPSRDFQVFDPLDFLAEVTLLIPDAGGYLLRYYRGYSNKNRGQRVQRQPSAGLPRCGHRRPVFDRQTCPGGLQLVRPARHGPPHPKEAQKSGGPVPTKAHRGKK